MKKKTLAFLGAAIAAVFIFAGCQDMSDSPSVSNEISQEELKAAQTELEKNVHKVVPADKNQISLPPAVKGMTVAWESDKPDVISKDGKVTHPEQGAGPTTVTLTAKLKKGEATGSLKFKVSVYHKNQPLSDKDLVEKEKGSLSFSVTAIANDETLSLPSPSDKTVSITWSSSHPKIIATDGTVNRPDGAGTTLVTLTATLKKGDATAIKAFSITVVHKGETKLDDKTAVALAKDALKKAIPAEVKADLALKLPKTAENGVTVAWDSNNTKVISKDGVVTRPDGKDSTTVTLTATLKRGTVTETQDFFITVHGKESEPENGGQDTPKPETPEEKNTAAVQGAKAALNIATKIKDPSDLQLPKNHGPVAISWESSNKKVITNDGAVAIPGGTGETQVKLTATLSLGKEKDTKEFTVTVYHKEQDAGDSVLVDKAAQKLSIKKTEISDDYDLQLPKEQDGIAVTWKSSDSATISDDGKVNRPFGEGTVTVTLTATLKKGTAEATRTFTVTVRKKPRVRDLSEGGIAGDMQQPEAWKAESAKWNKADRDKGVYEYEFTALKPLHEWKVLSKKNWGAPHAGDAETVPGGPEVQLKEGRGNNKNCITSNLKVDGKYKITVTAKNGGLFAKVEYLSGGSDEKTNQALVKQVEQKLLEIIPREIKSDDKLQLPTKLYGANIAWDSDKKGVIAKDGTVNRPAGAGKTDVTLTATIIAGSGAAKAELNSKFTVAVFHKGTSGNFVNLSAGGIAGDMQRPYPWKETEASWTHTDSIPDGFTYEYDFTALKPTHYWWALTTKSWNTPHYGAERLPVGTRVALRAKADGAQVCQTEGLTIGEKYRIIVTVLDGRMLAEVKKIGGGDTATAAADYALVNQAMGKIGIPQEVKEDRITLPTMQDGVSIEWKSENAAIIANDGSVHRPDGMGQTKVKLIAYFRKGIIVAERSFTTTVFHKDSDKPVDLSMGGIAGDMQRPNTWKAEDAKWNKADAATGVYEYEFTAAAEEHQWKVLSEKDWRKPNFGGRNVAVGAAEVKLTEDSGNAETGGLTLGKKYKITITARRSDIFAKIEEIAGGNPAQAQADHAAVQQVMTKITVPEEVKTDDKLNLPAMQDGVSIEWKSNKATIIANDGTVHRPDGAGQTTVRLQAIFRKGIILFEKEYTVTVVHKQGEKPEHDLSMGGIAGDMQRPNTWKAEDAKWNKADAATGVYEYEFTAAAEEHQWKVLSEKDWRKPNFGGRNVAVGAAEVKLTEDSGNAETDGLTLGKKYKITVTARRSDIFAKIEEM